MTTKCDVIHNLASKEIHSIMSEHLRPSSTTGKFLSLKAQKYYTVRYQHDFANFLNSSSDELRRLHGVYSDEALGRDVAAQEDMWEAAVKLHGAIVASESGLPKHRQNRFIHGLYENFYKMESKRCISRPNFVSCMNELFKHKAGDKSKCTIGLSFDALYDRFDMLGNNSFNWRRFLFYLHVVSHPTLDCRVQLLHAFSFIASHDGLDESTSAKACIDIHDIGTVLFPLVRAEFIHAVVSLMDEAWSNIRSSDSQGGKRMGTKLTYEVFEGMLAQENIVPYLNQSPSRWGRFESFPVAISQWEEEFYSKRLLELIRDERTKISVREKLQRDADRLKRRVWRRLKAYTVHEQSLRSILNVIDVRTMMKMKRRGFGAFFDWSTRSLAALTIERVTRGFFGRKVATGRWIIKQSAITIQCLVRVYFAKKALHELSSVYYLAVITVQRIIRGALGRRLAFKRLMTLVEQQHLSNMKEKERLLMLRGIWSVTRLQSCLRRRRATKVASELRAMRQRESDIQHAMEARSERFRKERKVYEKQLEEYYRSKKEEYLRDISIQTKVARDQVNVRTLRRRLRNDEIINMPPDNTEFFLTEEWKRDWDAKIEKGVDDIKHHCRHCLANPDNKAEKKINASVKKRIKTRTAEVLKRADSRGIPMETKEAKQIATEEVIHIIGEEERDRLENEKEKALEQRELDKEKARLEAEAKRKQEKSRTTTYAVSIVARACRIWLARRELRRRCLETYEKDYDEYSHRFYYRNTETGDLSWAKPKAMGQFEIPTKDEWKLLRDAHNFPYYFNPCRMDMQWNPPLDKTMCCNQVPHDWYREFPVRIGQCPNFATYEVDGTGYCEECMGTFQCEDVQIDRQTEIFQDERDLN